MVTPLAIRPRRIGSQGTFFVAASDAFPRSKLRADKVCTGTADDVEILAAIAALPSNGGSIEFSEGTFNASGSNFHNLDITKSRLTLRGQGPGVTIIKASTKDRHLIGNATATQTHVTIRDMTLDHDAVTLGTGSFHLMRLEGIKKVWLENLEILNSSHHGIVGLPDTASEVNSEWFLSNIYAQNIGVSGQVGGDAIRTHFGSGNVVIQNCILDGVELHGVHLGNHRAMLNNVIVKNSGQSALSLQSEGQIVSNFYAEWDDITSDLIANRPSAGTAGRWFYATDTAAWSRDNGSAWQAEANITMKGLEINTRASWGKAERIVINNVKLAFAVTENETYNFNGGDAVNIDADAGNVQINNLDIEGKFRLGILAAPAGLKLTNFVIENVRHHGIQLGESSGTTTGFIIDNGEITNSGQETANAAIFLHDSCRSARISHVRTSGSNHTHGIQENTSADNNIITDNDLNGTTTGLTKLGANTIARNNRGSSQDDLVADPGNGNAIPVLHSSHVPLVTTAAQTRTLADASGAGLTLDLYLKTDGGDCVVTAASPVNQAGNTIMTFADVGDHIRLTSIEDGADFEWRVVANDGVALS